MARRQAQYSPSLGADAAWKGLLASTYKSAKRLTTLPFEDSFISQDILESRTLRYYIATLSGTRERFACAHRAQARRP